MSGKNRLIYPLLKADDGRVLFDIEITDTEHMDVVLKFNVYEIAAWNMDNTHSQEDSELYLNGYIKWDGCSHFWFGAKDEEGKQDGYLHLCGKECFVLHCQMMNALYEFAAEHITNFDREVAE